MTATSAAPKKSSGRVSWAGRQIVRAGRFTHRQYVRGRDSIGDAWAPVPPAVLAGGEYAANENIPKIETSDTTDDMIISSAGAVALSGTLTLALSGMGVDIERKGVKRAIEATSTGVAAASDLALRIQVAGTEISHNPVVTWAAGLMAVGSAALGSIAGYSSGRALTR